MDAELRELLESTAAETRQYVEQILRTALEGVGAEFASVRSEFASVREQFAAVHAEFAAVHAEFAAVHAELASVHEDLASVHEELASVHEEIHTLERRFDKRFEDVDKRFDSTDRRIDDLRLHIDITGEDLRKNDALLAEGIRSLHEHVTREVTRVDDKMDLGFADTQQLVKYSYDQLDRRVHFLEQR